MKSESTFGVVCAGGAFLMWGVMPAYWKLLGAVPALELLCHRIVWGIPLLAVMVIVGRQGPQFRALLSDGGALRTLGVTTLLIALNWFLFIWSVNAGLVLQASLGYYMNPLVNVLLGRVFLGERLRRWQWTSVGLAALAVIILTAHVGRFPWVALVLALSFGCYGLLRKTVRAEAAAGLTVETVFLALPAVAYLVHREWLGVGSLGHVSPSMNALLILAGPVTVLPLLWFTMGARRLRLTTVGILQYLAPTGHFLLAVFAYGEPFGVLHLVAFALIWTALVVYTIEGRVHLGRRAARPGPEIAVPRQTPMPGVRE